MKFGFGLGVLGIIGCAQAQLLPYILPESNLRGTYVNTDRSNGWKLTKVQFNAYNCVFTKEMVCDEPDTVCAALAPQEDDGMCYYNQHTNIITVLMGLKNHTVQAIFGENELTLSTDNASTSCNETYLLASDSVHLVSI